MLIKADFIWKRNDKKDLFEIKYGKIGKRQIDLEVARLNRVYREINEDGNIYLIMDTTLNKVPNSYINKLHKNNLYIIDVYGVEAYFKNIYG